MIISRTPFRISFFGGGTDYPIWFRGNGGAVLSTTIDKYCYISCRRLPPFFEYKHRIVYSKYEHINKINDIVHPAVRETFRFMHIEEGLEIHHDGDLPARSGLGSSSSFTVGMLNALYALRGKMISKEQLAKNAIYVEQHMIKEDVGSQDQVAAAFGGFNLVKFGRDDLFSVNPVILSMEKLLAIESHLMLMFTGFSRTAHEIAKEQIKETPHRSAELAEMFRMVEDALVILNRGSDDITDFGRLLNEAWKIKRSLTSKISNSEIDEIYSAALSAGAIGGKLLGAGGGGFMLIFARPEDHPVIKAKLKDFLFVPFKFENSGSLIVVYQPDGLY